MINYGFEKRNTQTDQLDHQESEKIFAYRAGGCLCYWRTYCDSSVRVSEGIEISGEGGVFSMLQSLQVYRRLALQAPCVMRALLFDGGAMSFLSFADSWSNSDCSVYYAMISVLLKY